MTAPAQLDFAPSIEARPFPDWYTNPRDLTERRFRDFHQCNPEVYTELRRRVFAWLDAGARRVGIRRFWEAMRHDHELEVARTGGEPWKMNDHYAPLYARLLIHRHPELADVIETRGWR